MWHHKNQFLVRWIWTNRKPKKNTSKSKDLWGYTFKMSFAKERNSTSRGFGLCSGHCGITPFWWISGSFFLRLSPTTTTTSPTSPTLAIALLLISLLHFPLPVPGRAIGNPGRWPAWFLPNLCFEQISFGRANIGYSGPNWCMVTGVIMTESDPIILLLIFCCQIRELHQ